MQSGIIASKELHAAFQLLIESPDQRGLVCTIANEALTPVAVLEPATSFNDDLALLTPHVQATVARYFILRLPEPTTSAPFVAITYVPDAAPVRSKMLFAATRLALVRELGSEKFKETRFATSADELTPDGFQKYDQHVKLAPPLSEMEKSLAAVKRSEAESRGSRVRQSPVGAAVPISASTAALQVLQRLAESGTNENFVQLYIDLPSETMDLDSVSNISIMALASSICSTAPRYSLFRYTHTHEGVTSSPILFIYTCPPSSKIKERMVYAAFLHSAQLLAEEAGLVIQKKIEEGDPSEISEESIHADLHPPVEIKKGFERPRRPGASKLAR